MSDKCDSCNGTGYKGGVDPLDFKDYPDAGRLVFEKCGRCGGNGKAGDYASVDLRDGNHITRKGGVWRPSQMRGDRGELTIGTASESVQRALVDDEKRVKHLREALQQWGIITEEAT